MPVASNITKTTEPVASEIFDTWYMVGQSSTTNPFTMQSVYGAEFMFGRMQDITLEDGTKTKKFIPYKDSSGNFCKVSFYEPDFFDFTKQKIKDGDLSYKVLMDQIVEKSGQIAKERNILVVPS